MYPSLKQGLLRENLNKSNAFFNLLWAIVVVILGGCQMSNAALPIPLATTPTAAHISGWIPITDGLSWRTLTPESNILQQVIALKIDPAHYRFRAHYQAGQPLGMYEWQAQYPQAVAFINANFFTPENTITGLLVADGVAYGTAYQGFGGWFSVINGTPRVRSTALEPYQGEPMEQAIQAFPMLIANGAIVYNANQTDRTTRRTAIAQDKNGHIILLATPLTGIRLESLSRLLVQEDLQIVNAFNLDGGGSTMMYIRPNDFRLTSFDPVPAILAIYPQ